MLIFVWNLILPYRRKHSLFDLSGKIYVYIFFIFHVLFHHTKLLIADQICSGNLFESPSSLDRTRHSSSGINIFCTGTRSRGFSQSITAISYKSRTRLHPLLKGHLLASPSFISRRRSVATRPATFVERKYVKGIYEKGTTCISFGVSIAHNARPVSGRLTFVRVSTIKVSAALFVPRILRSGRSHRRTIFTILISKALPICHSRRKVDRKIQRVPEELYIDNGNCQVDYEG